MNKISLISEEKIDDIVISQADNDTEWEEPIHVRKTKPTSPAQFTKFEKKCETP